MLDLLLIKLKGVDNENVLEITGNYRISESIGICSISSFLRNNGFQVEMIDTQIIDQSEEDLIHYIFRTKPRLLGISIPFQISIPSVLSFVDNLRNAGYTGKIVTGGHPATFYYRTLLNPKYRIDYVCLGEGEFTTFELLQSLENGSDVSNIKGLAYRIDSEIIFNGYRALIENLDVLPFPSRDYLPDILKYKTGHNVDIVGSRGCSWSGCTFCDIQTFYKTSQGKGWRGRSPENIVAEIEYIHKNFNVNKFNFTDDDFLGPKKQRHERVFKFCNEIQKKGLRIEFNILCKVKDVEEELFLKLKEAGLINVFIGVETGVERALKTFHKGVTPDENKKAINALKSIGLKIRSGSILIDPYTTIDEIKENLSFWSEIEELSFSLYQEYYVLKGTPLWKTLENEGKLIEHNFNFFYKHNLSYDVQAFSAFMATFINTYFKRNFSRLRKFEKYILKYPFQDEDELIKLQSKIHYLKRYMHCTWFEELVNQLFSNIEKLDINNIDNQINELFGDRLTRFKMEFDKLSSKFRVSS